MKGGIAMFYTFLRRDAVLLLAAAVSLGAALAPAARAQQPTSSAQQMQGQASPEARASEETPAPQVQSAAEAEPLFREFKGVTIGMSAEEARAKLGNPQEKDKLQDFFVFSERERSRLYYDAEGKVSAVIVTYIGKDSNAPAPSAVLGAEVRAKPDGSMYHVVHYPKAG